MPIAASVYHPTPRSRRFVARCAGRRAMICWAARLSAAIWSYKIQSVKPDPAEVKDRHRDRLLDLPNVVALGIGPKMVDAAPTATLAIKVYVSKKVPVEELADRDRIPRQIEGIPTDVEEQAPLRAY